MNGHYGLCDLDKRVLHIATDLDDEMKRSTMIHEAMEALNYHLGLDMEESQIMAMEAGLFQVLVEAGVDLSPLDERLKEV